MEQLDDMERILFDGAVVFLDENGADESTERAAKRFELFNELI